MKKLGFLTLVNLILSLIQTALFPELLLGARAPNLIMSFAFALLILGLQEEALLSAFLGGLLFDFLGISMPGISSFVIIILILSVSFIRKYVFRGWLVTGIAFFSSHIIFTLVLNLPRIYPPTGMITGAFLTLFCTFLFYRISKNVFRKFAESGYKTNVD